MISSITTVPRPILPGTFLARPGLSLSCLLCILLSSACDRSDSYLFSGPTMGTIYNVTVVPVPARSKREVLATGIRETVGGINLRMSTYLEDSELSRFNRSSPGSWFEVSAETAEVISLGLKIIATLVDKSFTDPQRVFIFFMPHSATVTLIFDSHLAISSGICFRSRWRYHRWSTVSRLSLSVPGRTRNSSVVLFGRLTDAGLSCSMTLSRYRRP